MENFVLMCFELQDMKLIYSLTFQLSNINSHWIIFPGNSQKDNSSFSYKHKSI